MSNLLVKFFLLAALAELGLELTDFENCSSKVCLGKLQGLSLKVVRIEWKSISIFSNEAKRFH